MNRFRKTLNRLIFPAAPVVIVSIPIAATLLVYIFLSENTESPFAYLCYVFSAYSLTITCAKVIKLSRGAKSSLKTALSKNRFIHRCLTDAAYKTHISLYFSLGINLIYAGMKLVSGVVFQSVWFGTLGVYYLLLAIMRFLLLYRADSNSFGEKQRSELKKYRVCGIILMIMNIALGGVVALVVHKNEGFVYAGYLIYIMAIYAFYTVITAVRNVIVYRRYNSPVMSAAKVVNLAAALVSLLSLETAMLTQFDKGKNPEAFRQIMTGTTGGAVCLIVFSMSIFMIVKSTRKLNILKKENS